MAANVTSNTSASPRQISKNCVLRTADSSTDNADSSDSIEHLTTAVVQKPVLTAQFVHRAMINFQMPSHLIAYHLPVGLELLPFRSGYYVTFMASHIRGVKMFGLPIYPGFNAISFENLCAFTQTP